MALLLSFGPRAASGSALLAEDTIAPGERRTHAVTLAAGRLARLRVERSEADVDVVVRDAAGAVLVRAGTLTFPPGPLTFSLLATEAATSSIEVSAAPGSSATRYRIHLVEEREAEPADGARLGAERAYLEADRLRTLGAGDSIREALPAYERALDLARTAGEAVLEADGLTGLARVRDALGEKTAALALYEQALRRQRALGRTGAVAYVLGYAAMVHEHLGARPRALELLNDALAAARESGNRRVEGLTLNNIGLVHYVMGDHARALAHYEPALDAHREAGNPRGEATTLTGIGSVYDVTGEKVKALDTMHRALSLRRAVGDPRDLASTLNNIGAVHFSRGDAGEALDFYGQAAAAWREGGDRNGEAATLHNLAQVHEMAGEFQPAITLYHQALALFRASESKVREANSRTGLGRLHATLGDHTRARALFEEALPVHRANGNRQFEATTVFYMATLHAARREPAPALALFEQALGVQRQIKDRRAEAATLREMARVHLDSGDAPRAVAVYEEALAIDRAIQNRRGEGTTLARLALAQQATREDETARRSAAEAREIARVLGDARGEAFSLYALARVERNRSPSAAREHAEQALALVESMRSSVAGHELRAAFLAGAQDYFELAVDVLMQLDGRQPGQGFGAAAFEMNERARARSLLDRLSDARAGIREGVDPALLREERRVQQTLNAKAFRSARLPGGGDRSAEGSRLAKEIGDLTGELQHVQSEMRARNPRYALVTQPRTLALAEVQAHLDESTVLLEYALGAERSFLWRVTRDGFASYVLPARAEIEGLAARFRADVLKAAPAGAGGELADALLGPVARDLGGQRVVVVADGALQAVPLAALPLPGAGRALLATHEVVSLPSASTLALLRLPAGPRAASRSVMVLADPVFHPDDPRVRAGRRAAPPPAPGSPSPPDPTRSALDDEIARGGLGRLLGSRREAATILSLLPPGHGRQALDFEADRALATSGELARYRIVHFATHGLLDAERPELSGLVLSLVDRQGRPQDGFLRLHEIYNLRLPADLVVLSACQTGLGQDVRGEGLVGLTRGFMYAGTPRVLATLWKVDDRATAELMRRFYEAMLGPRRLSPAAALRAAQLSLSEQKRWQSPFYWAGFVLQGEWR